MPQMISGEVMIQILIHLNTSLVSVYTTPLSQKTALMNGGSGNNAILILPLPHIGFKSWQVLCKGSESECFNSLLPETSSVLFPLILSFLYACLHWDKGFYS